MPTFFEPFVVSCKNSATGPIVHSLKLLIQLLDILLFPVMSRFAIHSESKSPENSNCEISNIDVKLDVLAQV